MSRTSKVVFKPGSSVEIGPSTHPIVGVLTRVSIGVNESIEYKVSWWDGRTRVTDWFSEDEVRLVIGAEDNQVLFLGFK